MEKALEIGDIFEIGPGQRMVYKGDGRADAESLTYSMWSDFHKETIYSFAVRKDGSIAPGAVWMVDPNYAAKRANVMLTEKQIDTWLARKYAA